MSHPIRDAAIVCALAFTFGATWASPQVRIPARRVSATEAAAWREDLAYILNYRKSLELDPNNANARAVLEKLAP